MPKVNHTLVALLLLLILSNCAKDDPATIVVPEIETGSGRGFKMGFSTWPFGPNDQDRADTYTFIQANGDIYSEQVDDRIPWNAWINEESLPTEFVQNIDYRVSQLNPNLSLVLSISPLNTSRNDLIEDWNGSAITYTTLHDQVIEDAYFKHVEYLIERFNPDYLVSAMEVNDLLTNDPAKWEEFKMLSSNVQARLKTRFPALPISESVTLHNFFDPQVSNPSEYIQEVSDHIDQFDFAAVSFYPFFKNQHTKAEYQQAFDFLHEQVNKPIALVETNHLSEDLIIPSLSTNITGNSTEQQEYLEVLLENATESNYEFIIWWAHRDYDALWETFPDEVKDIGQIWRDTGLLDEDGTERSAFSVWTKTVEQ